MRLKLTNFISFFFQIYHYFLFQVPMWKYERVFLEHVTILHDNFILPWYIVINFFIFVLSLSSVLVSREVRNDLKIEIRCSFFVHKFVCDSRF